MSTKNIDQTVLGILNGMFLRNKAGIANMEKEEVAYLPYAFDKLVGEEDEMGKVVMHRIYEVQQETHRVRCVKS